MIKAIVGLDFFGTLVFVFPAGPSQRPFFFFQCVIRLCGKLTTSVLSSEVRFVWISFFPHEAANEGEAGLCFVENQSSIRQT